MTKGHFQELGVVTLCILDEGKKSFTICVGLASVCDLDVIQILSSGCWLHVHYNAACFGGVKYTIQLKAINEHVRSDGEMKEALPDGFHILLMFSRSSAICDVKRPDLIIRLRQMSELTHHFTEIFGVLFQVGFRKHQ